MWPFPPLHMSLPQPSQKLASSLSLPSDISSDTKLQDAPPPYPLSPPLSPSRNTTGVSRLRDTATLPIAAFSPSALRKSSSTSTLVPLPSPLRIFKRQTRKPSLTALLRRPSIQSLKAQLFPGSVAEPVETNVDAIGRSSHRHDPRHQSSIGQISTVELLPASPVSEDEGYHTDVKAQSGIQTPRVRSFSGEDEGYITDVHRDIDLLSPTPLERRTTNTQLTTTGPIHSICSLCKSELATFLETYAFPTTAPAIVGRIRSLFPAIDTNHHTRSPENSPVNNTTGTTGNTATPSLLSPTFCLSCFEKFHALHICWTCGLTVHRQEERVGYGWAWWHWGCMSCLLCRAPVHPPAWVDGAITLSDSPACRSCLRELRDLVYVERRKLHATRRGFSPPWRPDVGFGIDCHNGAGGGDGGYQDVGNINNGAASSSPAGTRHGRRISGLLERLNALDGSAPSVLGAPEPRNRRMSWMMRKGEGLVGGGAVGSGHSSRWGSASSRLGAMVYPPLPKWMEKLPGRRNVSGGVRKVSVK